MAILDADKEGFLRSERSLIQTIGRAARNVFGTVILYADSMTDSMKRAIDETERRRRLQAAFNKKHGITPQSIIKALGSPLIKIYDADYVDIPIAAEKAAKYGAAELPRMIRKLQKEMKQAAERLDFEAAAELRDRIRELQNQELALRESPLVPSSARKRANVLGVQRGSLFDACATFTAISMGSRRREFVVSPSASGAA